MAAHVEAVCASRHARIRNPTGSRNSLFPGARPVELYSLNIVNSYIEYSDSSSSSSSVVRLAEARIGWSATSQWRGYHSFPSRQVARTYTNPRPYGYQRSDPTTRQQRFLRKPVIGAHRTPTPPLARPTSTPKHTTHYFVPFYDLYSRRSPASLTFFPLGPEPNFFQKKKKKLQHRRRCTKTIYSIVATR